MSREPSHIWAVSKTTPDFHSECLGWQEMDRSSRKGLTFYILSSVLFELLFPSECILLLSYMCVYNICVCESGQVRVREYLLVCVSQLQEWRLCTGERDSTVYKRICQSLLWNTLLSRGLQKRILIYELSFHTPMQPLHTGLISISSSSQFSQHFPSCSHVVGTVLGTVGTERWRPVFKGKLVPSMLTEEALKEELLRSCASNFARPSALSINPARSSDLKMHLWSPRWRGSQRLYCSQKRVMVKEERPFCIPITIVTVQNPQKVPCSLMSDSFEATIKS